ncbi:MAG: hypothetical protein QXZ41_04670 [Ignisphaera sp.]|uniref:Thioredoxin domain-containing protein n=1 Tax=Ignisphaera aggregans TaxID=334771 RepID=A0A7C4NLN9_9CREN
MSTNSSQSLKTVNETSPHGIYIYDHDDSVWHLIRSDGEPFKPDKKGIYVIYFDNTKCSACRKYDTIWFPFIENNMRNKKQYNFIIVLCNWFARDCNSTAAAETFKRFDVHASPTTIVLYVDENNEIKYQEKYEGVLYEFEIKLVLDGFEERVAKALRGEKVSPPIEKKSSNVLDEIILQILKAIIEKGDKQER